MDHHTETFHNSAYSAVSLHENVAIHCGTEVQNLKLSLQDELLPLLVNDPNSSIMTEKMEAPHYPIYLQHAYFPVLSSGSH